MAMKQKGIAVDYCASDGKSNFYVVPIEVQRRRFLPFLNSHSDKNNACNEIAEANSASKMGSALNKLIESYYKDALNQGRQSFILALVASGVDTFLFFGALGWTMKPSENQKVPQSTPALSNVKLLAGALVEVIAGINFYLYFRASRQMAAYHICLERTNRFLLANAICNELSEEIKDGSREKLIAMREKLVETMMNAPMLTVAQATGTLLRTDRERASLKSASTNNNHHAS